MYSADCNLPAPTPSAADAIQVKKETQSVGAEGVTPSRLFSVEDHTPARVINIINSVEEVNKKIVLLSSPGLFDRATVFKGVLLYTEEILTSASEAELLAGALNVVKATLSCKKICGKLTARALVGPLLETFLPLLLDVLVTSTSELLWSASSLLAQIAKVPQLLSSVGVGGLLVAIHAYATQNLTPWPEQLKEEGGVLGVERLLWASLHALCIGATQERSVPVSSEVAVAYQNMCDEIGRDLPELRTALEELICAFHVCGHTVPPMSKWKSAVTRKHLPTEKEYQTMAVGYFKASAAVLAAVMPESDGQTDASPSRGAEDAEIDGLVFSPGKITPELLTSVSKLERRREEGLKTYLCRVSHVNLCDLQIRSVRNLQYCTNLKVLNVDDNRLLSLQELAFAHSLTHLYAQRNLLRSFADIPSLPSLVKLYLNENQIESLDGIQRCPAIEELHVASQGGCLLLSAGDVFASLHKLQTLCLSHNQLDNLSALKGHCTALRELDVRSNMLPCEDVEGLTAVLYTMPSLTTVHLAGNDISRASRIKDRLILTCPRLTMVDNAVVTNNERDYVQKISNRRTGHRRESAQDGAVRTHKPGDTVKAAPPPPRRGSATPLDLMVQAKRVV